MTQIQFKNVTDQILANIQIHTKLIQNSSELIILLQEFGLSFPRYNPVEFFRLEDRCRHFIDFVDCKADISKACISTVDQNTRYPKSLLSQELCVIVTCMIYDIHVTVTYTKDCITILTSRKGEDVYVTYTLDFSYRSYTTQYIYDFILEKVLSYYTSKSKHNAHSANSEHTINNDEGTEVKESVSFGPKFIEKWNAARDPTDPAGWSSLRHLRNNENYVNSVRGAQPEHPKSEWFQVPDTN